MLSKMIEVLKIMGFDIKCINDNLVMESFKFDSFNVLGIDTHNLKNILFSTLYADELCHVDSIEAIIDLDWIDSAYDRFLSEMLVELEVGTITNGLCSKNLKDIYKTLAFLDFGTETNEFVLPLHIDQVDGVVSAKMVSSYKTYRILKKQFGKDISLSITYDKKVSLFVFKNIDMANLNMGLKCIYDDYRVGRVEKYTGYTDPLFMILHIVMMIIAKNKEVYNDTLNDASIVKIIDEFNIY